VEREFRRYLECGVLAHGLARVRCSDYGNDGRAGGPSACALFAMITNSNFADG
jgi:hypothetical protein